MQMKEARDEVRSSKIRVLLVIEGLRLDADSTLAQSGTSKLLFGRSTSQGVGPSGAHGPGAELSLSRDSQRRLKDVEGSRNLRKSSQRISKSRKILLWMRGGHGQVIHYIWRINKENRLGEGDAALETTSYHSIYSASFDWRRFLV